MADGLRHVLMTADGVGGVWDHALTLAAGLAARGIGVTLAVLGGPLSDDQRTAARAVAGLEPVESGWPLEWMPDAWPDGVARSGDWLLGLAERVRPDLVHVNGYAHAALPFGVPAICAAHSDVRSWFAAVHGTGTPAEYDAYGRAVAAGLRTAAAVVAPSRAQLAALAFHYGVAFDGVAIPNGLGPDGFAPGRKEPVILSVGRVWDEAKNIALLDRVAPGLGAPVVVAGPTRHPDGGDRSPRHVRALGRVPKAELADWYGRAAVFCLPARYEPFGLAALEAALSGCALVLGALPALREIWGDAALYVHPDDADGLRRTLNGLMADAGRRSDLAHRARLRARRYPADAMVEAYRAVYAAAIAPAGLAAAGLAAAG